MSSSANTSASTFANAVGKSVANASGEAIHSNQSLAGGEGSKKSKTRSPSKRQQNNYGSFLDRVSGRRPMKEYPLTESELKELQMLGTASTLFFSLASGIGGFLIDLQKDLSLLQSPEKLDVDFEKKVSFWTGAWWVASFGVIIFLILGGIAYWRGSSRIAKIMDETTHDEE